LPRLFLAYPQFFPDDHMPEALATLKSYRAELFEEVSGLIAGRGT
jgi:hypothetical protein